MHASRVQTFIFCALCSLFSVAPVVAQDPPEDAGKLDEAIAVLRNIDPSKLSEKEQQEMSARMDEAWKTLRKAGDAGRKRILQELKKIEEEKIKDDYFKIDVSKLLWVAWRFEEVDTIASIWLSVPLAEHYNICFHIAFEAAGSKGVRALPLMKALLHDDEGRAFVPQHSMVMAWPEPLEFVWGVYGPAGLPELVNVLKESKDPVELKSAIRLLAAAGHDEALPTIRELARKGPSEVRDMAIEALGYYGHPDDREFLVAGLASKEQATLGVYLGALAYYGDMSAAAEIAKLLQGDDKRIRSYVAYVLTNLAGSDALKALHDYAAVADNEKDRDLCRDTVDRYLGLLNLTYEEFAAMPTNEADLRLLEVNPAEAEYRLKPDDKKLTRKDFKKACRGWISNNRITGGDYEWVESRHVMAIATPRDLKRLHEVRAAVYRRLSDECLYEVAILEDLTRRINRMRYRKTPGLCAKVEAAPSSTEKPA